MVNIADLKCQIPTEQFICKQNRNRIENTDEYCYKPYKPFTLMFQFGIIHQFQRSEERRVGKECYRSWVGEGGGGVG